MRRFKAELDTGLLLCIWVVDFMAEEVVNGDRERCEAPCTMKQTNLGILCRSGKALETRHLCVRDAPSGLTPGSSLKSPSPISDLMYTNTAVDLNYSRRGQRNSSQL